MRSICLFFLIPLMISLSTMPLCASDRGTTLEKQIMNKILRAFSRKKHGIRVYYHGNRRPAGLRNNPSVVMVSSPRSADVIILGSSPPSGLLKGLNKPILTLDYGMLRRYPDALGAYFWQKGRPNIIMIRSRLSRVNIRLPADFDRYIENTLW